MITYLLNFSLGMAQIGFSAPQGCGKTTLVYALDYLFRVTGRFVLNLEETVTLNLSFERNDYLKGF